jgi:hypothetical protein
MSDNEGQVVPTASFRKTAFAEGAAQTVLGPTSRVASQTDAAGGLCTHALLSYTDECGILLCDVANSSAILSKTVCQSAGLT